MKRNKYILLICLITICTFCSKRIKNENSLTIAQPKSYNNVTDKIIHYDKNYLLGLYYNELLDSLKVNKVPDFFYDNCLDVNSGYCRVNSHETISLRYDIIKKLTKIELDKILLYGNLTKLKQVCSEESSLEVIYNKRTTYELLKEIQQQ